MSQRLGMADGRCFTINTASQLLNNYVMEQNNIGYADNYVYRQLLQKQGPDVIERIVSMQQVSKSGGPPFCNSCDTPLLKVPNTY